MKKAIMQLWVKALRSGRYKQGMKRLRSANNEYCCLGVLCQISKQTRAKKTAVGYLYDGQVGYLPEKVQTWAGISSHHGDIQNNSLASLNDAGRTFEDIADIIEKHYKEL